MLFEQLNLIEPIRRALKFEGYSQATPIQVKAIPELLKGVDLMGCAQTGTGKTAAFAIPILTGLSELPKPQGKRPIKALAIAPTRELAIQISESFRAYGKYLGLKSLVIYGGVSQHPQARDLASGVDILVATPGRLLDLINQKLVNLSQVKYFVLDEADMMLDMGMIQDVRRIITYLPPVRQNMMFSATMPTEIAKLADTILNNPTRIDVAPAGKTIDIVNQSVYFVDKVNKVSLLIELLKNTDIESALVFGRTKHGCDKIVKSLERAGLSAQAIHGNKSQNARQFALSNFKERKIRILVATDIAARGIDIDQLSHVFNVDLPEVAETYVHRIGRTGRAGSGGTAISFCSHEEKSYFKSIEKLIGKSIPEVKGHNYPLVNFTEDVKEEKFVRTPRPQRPATAKKPFVGKSYTAKKEQSYNHARKAGQRSKSN